MIYALLRRSGCFILLGFAEAFQLLELGSPAIFVLTVSMIALVTNRFQALELQMQVDFDRSTGPLLSLEHLPV